MSMDANRYFSMKKYNIFNIMQNQKNLLSLWCSDPVSLSSGVVTLSLCLVPLDLVMYTKHVYL